MTGDLLLDPLLQTFRDSIAEPAELLGSLRPREVALLLIDLQKLCAAEGIGVFGETAPAAAVLEARSYYFDSLARTVLPNAERLLRAFRQHGLEVIHTRIQSLTPDGRDRSPGHKRLRLHAAPGSREAEFLPPVEPAEGEIVINKTASGVFSATNLEYVLRNLGVRALFVAGVYTNECVSTAVRDGSDLGFHMTLIQDACTTVTPDLQTATIRTLRDRYARVMRTDAVLREVQRRRAEHDRMLSGTGGATERPVRSSEPDVAASAATRPGT
jgi:nicotinamidase-related amidase